MHGKKDVSRPKIKSLSIEMSCDKVLLCVDCGTACCQWMTEAEEIVRASSEQYPGIRGEDYAVSKQIPQLRDFRLQPLCK